MMKAVRRLVIGIPLFAAAPALAQAPDVYSADANTVVVVTPQPVVVSGASPQGPGVADMAPVPAVPPAPYTDQWSNVSHINGQVVPVGQRGDYLYKSKTTNIATNPIGWLMGVFGISVSRALNNNFAIRGDANLFKGSDMFGSNASGYELGATGQLYFRRVFSGPFLEGGLLIREFHNEDPYYDDDASRHTTVGPQILLGWHWTFDSGWNVAFAFGGARDMNSETSEYDYSDDDMQPAGYLRIGYAY